MSVDPKCPCSESCPLQEVIAAVGGKWKLAVLCSLQTNGPSRYNTILKSIQGISNTMLSQTLKELEAAKLVSRQEYMEVPIRVEYSLTEKALRLKPILEDMIRWYYTE